MGAEAMDDSVREDFLQEAGELVDQLGLQLMGLESQASADTLNAIFRVFHTLKGGAGFLGCTPLVELSHAAEEVIGELRNGRRSISPPLLDALLEAQNHIAGQLASVAERQPPAAAPAALLAALREGGAAKTTIDEDEFERLLDQLHGAGGAPGTPVTAPLPSPAAPARPPAEPAPAASAAPPAEAPAETIRVETARLDRLMNGVGELVLVRNRLKALTRAEGSHSAQTPLGRAVRELDFITRSLQDAVMACRMQPVGKVFARVPRLARDLARSLGKQVEVVLQGADSDLDKNLVEALSDPLLHLVRNSLDHGLETPEVRRAAGKREAGTLTLSARQEGGSICIELADDGAGIDPERVRSKALAKGLIDEASAARLSNEECLQLIFRPGFSTRETVSDLSGRGVGMDVVQSTAHRLNGSVSVRSVQGQGTQVSLRLPLTLAILPALMVEAGERRLAIPLTAVQDVTDFDATRVRSLEGRPVLTGAQTLPLLDLARWAGAEQAFAAAPGRRLVRVRLDSGELGLVVDQVRGREEVVIKPLGESLSGLAGLSGATVTPEGRVALILDLNSLVRAVETPSWTS